MIRVRTRLVLALAALAVPACNCNGTGDSYVYERENTVENGSPAGTACTLDSECESGRCQGGVCSDGSCDSDDDCREGELCVFGECVPDDNFECTADIHPIIDVNPAEVDFGAVLVGSSDVRTVVIRNLGSCLLTLQGIGFSTTTPSDFTCASCAPSDFPRRLPPNRSMEVNLTFTPAVAGNREGTLQIRSDDESYPVLTVPLHGRYEGSPRFLIEPEYLDFGFVDPAAAPPANSAARTIRLSNVGDGNAILTITDVRLASAAIAGFTIEPQVTFPNTVQLSPTSQGATDCLDTGGCYDITATFTPTAFTNFTNDVVITYEPAPAEPSQRCPAPNDNKGCAKVQLKGFSTTPPILQLSETLIDFGDQQLASVVTPRVITVTNAGQTPMTVQVTVSPLSSSDFSVEAFTPLEVPVRPGEWADFRVFYDPTVLGQVAGEIRIATNDPVTYEAAFGAGVKTLALRGNGTPNIFNDIMKVDMTWENGDNGFFGNDFRKVNLHLESAIGNNCTEPTYQLGQNGQILGIAHDPCDDWDTTTEGTANWLAIGAAQEPQRVILTGAPTNPIGPYILRASYEEDCASIPTGLVAGLLGIGVDALVGYISGGTIDLGSGDIANFIQNNCWDREDTTARITVFINGTATLNCSKRLGSRGDNIPLAQLARSNGQFTATCQ